MRTSDHINRYRVRRGEMDSDDSNGMYGMFQIPLRENLVAQIIASGGDKDDALSDGWEHVSGFVRCRNAAQKWIERTPTWDEMCHIKDLFWDETETVVQFHPPKSEYVNNHKNCLHLWRHNTMIFPLPDSLLVGIKGLEYENV